MDRLLTSAIHGHLGYIDASHGLDGIIPIRVIRDRKVVNGVTNAHINGVVPFAILISDRKSRSEIFENIGEKLSLNL